MSHPNLDPVPPLANIISRMSWHRDTIRKEPARYDSRDLTALRAEAMELFTAADRELMARARL
jgi:hypothetical protein